MTLAKQDKPNSSYLRTGQAQQGQLKSSTSSNTDDISTLFDKEWEELDEKYEKFIAEASPIVAPAPEHDELRDRLDVLLMITKEGRLQAFPSKIGPHKLRKMVPSDRIFIWAYRALESTATTDQIMSIMGKPIEDQWLEIRWLLHDQALLRLINLLEETHATTKN